MTTYTIIFYNERQQAGQYAVFADPPVPIPGASVFSNVWQSFNAAVGGSFKISSTTNYFAWVGTVPMFPAPGVMVSTSDALPVTLGTQTVPGTTYPMVVTGGSVSLDEAAETRTAPSQAFEIDTGSDFNVPNTRYVLGMALADQSGHPAPTNTIIADNNMQCSITPIVKFYISESQYTAGSVVNFTQASLDAAEIDFSSNAAAGLTTAIVTHSTNGTFAVTFPSSESLASIYLERAAVHKSQSVSVRNGQFKELSGQLQALQSTLAKMGLGISAPAAAPVKNYFEGKVSWPSTLTATTVTHGAEVIRKALQQSNWGCSYSIVTEPNGTLVAVFRIGIDLHGKTGEDTIHAEWTAAVSVDIHNAGHKNLGIKQLSHGSEQRPLIEANGAGLISNGHVAA